MSGPATGGRVVVTPKADQPYKVVLEHSGDVPDSEHPVSTMRAGEAMIRRESGAVAAGSQAERGEQVSDSIRASGPPHSTKNPYTG